MSDTPRTDEAEANAMLSGIPVSMVSRQLERELAEARECLSHAIIHLGNDENAGPWSVKVLERWTKAAGLTNSRMDANAPIVNWGDK